MFSQRVHSPQKKSNSSNPSFSLELVELQVFIMLLIIRELHPSSSTQLKRIANEQSFIKDEERRTETVNSDPNHPAYDSSTTSLSFSSISLSSCFQVSFFSLSVKEKKYSFFLLRWILFSYLLVRFIQWFPIQSDRFNFYLSPNRMES